MYITFGNLSVFNKFNIKNIKFIIGQGIENRTNDIRFVFFCFILTNYRK